MRENVAIGKEVFKHRRRYGDTDKPTRELLDRLRYRLNLCNLYMIYNFCSVAGIDISLSGKHPRYDAFSFIELRKKRACQDVINERYSNMSKIVSLAGEGLANKISFAIDDIEEHLKADGYRL